MKARSVSFATFNLLNLNEPGQPMYRDATGWTEAEVTEKVSWIGGMLKRATADVIGFQEMWHAGPLERALALAGLADSHVLLSPPGHDGTSIVCAAAVRRDLLVGQPVWTEAFPPAFRLQSKGEDAQTSEISVSVKRFSRPVLHLQVQPREDRLPIHVFVCHFKSKGPTEVFSDPWYLANPDLYKPHTGALGTALSTIRRTAEATALRLILTDLMKGNDAPVVVLGDLNDGQDSNTLDVLSESPPYLKPFRTGGRDTALYSGQGLQQLRSLRDVYYTYIHERQHGSLDHILVSRELYEQNRDRIWVLEGVDIFNDHLVEDKADRVVGPTDHGIVRARFSFTGQG